MYKLLLYTNKRGLIVNLAVRPSVASTFDTLGTSVYFSRSLHGCKLQFYAETLEFGNDLLATLDASHRMYLYCACCCF